jgi:DNA-binding CsgD family transcriptional regulator
VSKRDRLDTELHSLLPAWSEAPGSESISRIRSAWRPTPVLAKTFFRWKRVVSSVVPRRSAASRTSMPWSRAPNSHCYSFPGQFGGKWQRPRSRISHLSQQVSGIGNLHVASQIIWQCLPVRFILDAPSTFPIAGSAMDPTGNLSHLLLLLYEGVSSPERMPVFLQALVQAVHADAGVLREHRFSAEQGVQAETSELFESAGYSAEALRDYQAYYWKVDPFLQRLLERCPDAECGVSQMLINDTELKRSELYSDWSRRYDNVGRMIWAKLPGEAGFHSSLSIVRGLETPHFDNAELQVIASLAPHLRQASRLARSLRELNSSNAMLQQGLDEMGIAISMVSCSGSVLRSTGGAEHVLAARNGIWLQNHRLRTALPAEQGVLDALIAGACQTCTSSDVNIPLKARLEAACGTTIRSWTAPSGGGMLITRRPPCRPLQVIVSPFRSGSLLEEEHAAALVQFCDPSAAPKPRAAILRAMYHLTATEARIADLLLQGMDVRDTAERVGTSFETARFHLKRVFSKTGVGRQADLIRLMLSLPGA